MLIPAVSAGNMGQRMRKALKVWRRFENVCDVSVDGGQSGQREGNQTRDKRIKERGRKEREKERERKRERRGEEKRSDEQARKCTRVHLRAR